MSQQLIFAGSVTNIPGAYSQYTVETSTGGLATNGVIVLVGEANAGPGYTLETDLSLNAFGPDQFGAVSAKYLSGNLVDAFLNSVAASNDPGITGSFSKAILVKTNLSTKAQSSLPKNGGGSYGILADANYGNLGNLIYYNITGAPVEVPPTTGSFTFLPPISAFDMSLRLNGGLSENLTVPAGALPNAFQAAVAGLAGVACTGGVNRATITAIAGNLTVAAVGFNVTITISTSWNVNPSIGDTLYIPTGSAVQGATNKNRGSYVVTGSSNTVISATKLMDNAGAPGSLTAPENVGSTPVVAITDVECFSPVIISQLSAAIIDGIGKDIEINELTTNTDFLSNCCYALSSTKVNFISKLSVPFLIVSASEQAVSLNVNRQVDNVQQNIIAGGPIALKIGYTGTSCSVVISPTTLTATVVGGAGANLTINLKSYSTLNDLAAFINSQAGYSSSVGTVALGQQSPLALDEGTFTGATTFGNQTLRLKMDAYSFFQAVSTQTNVVQLNIPPSQAVAGLPALQAAVAFLSGGIKGSTTEAQFQAAIDALQAVDCNFVVPLISRNASLDIIDGLTESGSTYLIDSVNAYTNTHCIQMSSVFNRKNRQCFLSKEDTFANVKVAAQNIASFRAALSFQDEKNISPTAGIIQYQPWMTSVSAAGMQAAGFYKALTHKSINANGFLQKAGDFNPNVRSQVTDAINAGLLLTAKSTLNGGNYWIVDQTTYSKDNNFVFNSIQAVYAADVLALTVAQRMEQAIVGQAVADVNKQLALAVLTQILRDLLKLKILSPSDQAPAGFNNINITINPPTMAVSFNAFLDTELLFIPISFTISPVSQSISG